MEDAGLNLYRELCVYKTRQPTEEDVESLLDYLLELVPMTTSIEFGGQVRTIPINDRNMKLELWLSYHQLDQPQLKVICDDLTHYYRTNQPFNFTGLPTELQNMILSYLPRPSIITPSISKRYQRMEYERRYKQLGCDPNKSSQECLIFLILKVLDLTYQNGNVLIFGLSQPAIIGLAYLEFIVTKNPNRTYNIRSVVGRSIVRAIRNPIANNLADLLSPYYDFMGTYQDIPEEVFINFLRQYMINNKLTIGLTHELYGPPISKELAEQIYLTIFPPNIYYREVNGQGITFPKIVISIHDLLQYIDNLKNRQNE